MDQEGAVALNISVIKCGRFHEFSSTLLGLVTRVANYLLFPIQLLRIPPLLWSISTATANPETVTLVSSVRLTIPDQRSFNISPSQQSMKFSVWNSFSPFYTNKICIKTDLEIFANCTSVTIMESRVNDDEADSFMLQPRYNGTFFYTPYQLGRMFHRLITIHGHLNPPLSLPFSLSLSLFCG